MTFKIIDEKTREAVKEFIDKLNILKAYNVSITQKKKIRTLQQNRLYWLYLTCLEDETGNDKEDLHSFFKGKFLKTGEGYFGEEVITKTASTKKLGTKRFTKYIDQIVVFAAQEGYYLPNPKDKYWDEFYEHYKDL